MKGNNNLKKYKKKEIQNSSKFYNYELKKKLKKLKKSKKNDCRYGNL